ncbi:MAG: hypothetical protein KIT31_26520 [Deltaproteobacteria bacterium]|nr:hypothetical protein [Deltaproteobacteria bacterium]
MKPDDDLIGELRTLAADEREAAGADVDWAALERSIHTAVGTEVPRPWWRRRWLLPGVATLAAAAAVVAILARTPKLELGAQPVPVAAASPPDAGAPEKVALKVALWLDGTGVEVTEDAEVLDALDDLEASQLRGSVAAGPELVVSDLRWVDDLEDAALDEVEHALDAVQGKRG